MNIHFSRRDFLKLSGLLSLGYVLPHWMAKPGEVQQNASTPNVLVIVFDTFSASNISLYGYPRQTTPHIERLAEKATVFHNHYAGGNFTTPGTATLMTGVLPWTHRAFGVYDVVTQSFAEKSIFHAFSEYHRGAYSHNLLANTLLKDFFTDLEGLTSRESLYLQSDYLVNLLFEADEDIATVGWRRGMKSQTEGYAYALYLSRIYEKIKGRRVADLEGNFPLGLPNMVDDNYFVLEDGIDWLRNLLPGLPRPFLGYYHFNPPHDPYHTRADFFGTFAGDGFRPPDKPRHIFQGHRSDQKLLESRRNYDEFILYVDSEFGRLYRSLADSGVLENTWLVLTSDHGEMFERGFLGHRSKVLYQPVIHIPLLIFAPGQTTRQDVYEATSAIDLLPTLMQVTGHPLPDWVEGNVLPPYSQSAAVERDVFSLQVEGLSREGRITNATAALIRGKYKLQYYFGYEELGETGEMFELFDIDADPEELHNLYQEQAGLGADLLAVLKARLARADAEFQANPV